MKKIFSIIFILIVNSVLFAQDKLILENGDTLLCKIEEISEQSIKFKKIELLDGPVFNYDINSVKTVIFENGFIETFIKKTNQTPSIIRIEDLVDKKIIEENKYGSYYFNNKKIEKNEVEALLSKSNNHELPELIKKQKQLKKNKSTVLIGMSSTLILSVSSLYLFVFSNGVFYGGLPISAWFGVASGVQLFSCIYLNKKNDFYFDKTIETYNKAVISE
jgi:hypothetical protein